FLARGEPRLNLRPDPCNSPGVGRGFHAWKGTQMGKIGFRSPSGTQSGIYRRCQNPPHTYKGSGSAFWTKNQCPQPSATNSKWSATTALMPHVSQPNATVCNG